jgi:hypothetical protein
MMMVLRERGEGGGEMGRRERRWGDGETGERGRGEIIFALGCFAVVDSIIELVAPSPLSLLLSPFVICHQVSFA